MTNIFEAATRAKLRFESPAGALTAEDLWDLRLTAVSTKANLDDIARALHRKLRDADDVSFVLAGGKTTDDTQLKFDVVKHVIDIRLAEQADAEAAKGRRETKARILEIIAQKQDESLKGKSLEDLQALAASL